MFIFYDESWLVVMCKNEDSALYITKTAWQEVYCVEADAGVQTPESWQGALDADGRSQKGRKFLLHWEENTVLLLSMFYKSKNWYRVVQPVWRSFQNGAKHL